MKVFWLDSHEAVGRLRVAAARLMASHPEVSEVRLFGSLAEGRAVPNSDADVLVLLDRSHLRWFDRPLEYGPAFEAIGLSVDLFCYTREEAERIPLAKRAAERGLPLADRDATPSPAA